MHDNPALFSIIVAVIFPFLVIALGFFIRLFGEALMTIVGMALAPVVAQAIVNYVFFPGVIIHEMAHAFVAIITGAEITEVALFKKEGDSLGHVNFKPRGNKVLVAIQSIFISSAPMYIGAAVIWGCFNWLTILPTGGVVFIIIRILIWYLMISMFYHMTMSNADIKVYVKGIPIFIIIMFVIVLAYRMAGII